MGIENKGSVAFAEEENQGISESIENSESDFVIEEKKEAFKVLENNVDQVDKKDDLETFKGYVDEAESIEGLIEVLSLRSDIVGSEGVRSQDVIRSIKDVEEFLEENMNDIVTGVINKGATHYRDLLGKKLLSIHPGGDLAIKNKVRELLKVRMDESFRENKVLYVEQAVHKSNSFEQLYEVVKQLRGVNMEEEGSPRYTSEQTVKFIEIARHDFEAIITDPKLLNSSPEIIDRQIENLLLYIPQDSGIKDKVGFLLRERLKEKKLESFSSDSRNMNQTRKSDGFFGKFKKYLRRK